MAGRNNTKAKLAELTALLKAKSAMLIIVQDNPDPDGMASAMALRALANTLGVNCSVACGGTVGRGENRALVRYTGLNLRELDDTDPDRFDLVALVDAQPGQRNATLPKNIAPEIVIDHHPLRPATRSAAFTDIRRHYGATSTILFEYLQAASVQIDSPLATALLYGIRSDTQDFDRSAKQADTAAAGILYDLANKKMLGAIQRGKVPLEYFQMLATALENARRCGKSIYSDLGKVDNTDMVAEVADLLLRYEDADWSLCWGRLDGKVSLSFRTLSTDPSAERVARYIVQRKGSAGGHPSMAAGQIPFTSDKTGDRDRLDKTIRRRFLKITGANPSSCRRIT